MARIRSIKPEFFIDEELQDLEVSHVGAYCMLVFAGLWGHCSKDGVFEYKPRTLKLSILPFIDFSMADTLVLLEEAGFIRRFCVDDKQYGFIPGFEKHQRISGKESQYSPKHPAFTPVTQEGSNGEATGKNQGSTREAQEKEKEKEKEKENKEQQQHACEQLAEVVDERQEDLQRLFPDRNIPVASEKLQAFYASRPERLLDPWMVALKWFQREFRAEASHSVTRASPEPQKSKALLREEANIEATQEALRLVKEMRDGTRREAVKSAVGVIGNFGRGIHGETAAALSAGAG